MTVEPLPYHHRAVAHLRAEVPESWGWFARVRQSAQAAEQTRIELLKCTYRLDRAAHDDLYRRADAVAARLGVDAPLTLYQAQAPGGGINASIWYQADEAHIVLQGPLLASLGEAEVDSVLAHELGHHRLWRDGDGDFGTADRLLAAIAGRPDAEACHAQTLRRWSLATEVYADRCALHATGDINAVIAALVRIETGAAAVDVRAYLAQAEEVLAAGADHAEGATHPECFIRAVALAAYRRQGADAEALIERLLIGPLDPGALDIFGQRACEELTRRLVATILDPGWMRSARCLAHARLFFPDCEPGGAAADLDGDLAAAAPGLRDYVCALLLDFAAADPDLGDAALARGFELAGRWGWDDRLAELALRDLKAKARELARLRGDLAGILAAAGRQADGPAGAAP